VFSALCPNREGLARAKDGGIPEVAVFMSASESHNRKNTNRTIAESLAVYRELVGEAKLAGLRVRAYVSTVWGCPFEGDVSPAFAVEIGEKLYGFGCYQVSFGDTIGVGTPRQTEALTRRFLDHLPVEAIALHMHDTRGTALANVLAGLRLGIRHVDTSVAGMGGCPYAPGAAGNLSTEDLVYMLHGMGIGTGIDLDKLLAAGALAEQMVGRALPSKMLKAGPFQAKPLARAATRPTSSGPPTAPSRSGGAS
jgi:hydroxymethylglutaryl-CoA lyase